MSSKPAHWVQAYYGHIVAIGHCHIDTISFQLKDQNCVWVCVPWKFIVSFELSNFGTVCEYVYHEHSNFRATWFTHIWPYVLRFKFWSLNVRKLLQTSLFSENRSFHLSGYRVSQHTATHCNTQVHSLCRAKENTTTFCKHTTNTGSHTLRTLCTIQVHLLYRVTCGRSEWDRHKVRRSTWRLCRTYFSHVRIYCICRNTTPGGHYRTAS